MPANAYREDLAYIHDSAYGGLAEAAAQKLIEELEKRGLRTGTVVDLGCGSGVLAGIVARAGYHVIGFDFSDAMVAIARQRIPEVEFYTRSFISATIPACVAVTAIGEILSYTFDERNGAQAAIDFFRRSYEALTPGGLLMFDVAGTERSTANRRTFAEGPDWAVLVDSQVDESKHMLTRQITSFRQVGDFYRRDTETHRLMLLDPAEVLQSLQSIGLKAQRLTGYSDEPMPEGIVAFLACKLARDAG